MRNTISVENAADIAMRLATDAVANAVAAGGDDGFDARFHRSLFLAACADVETRESKARAIRAGAMPAAPTASPAQPSPRVDPIIASAVAAGLAEFRASEKARAPAALAPTAEGGPTSDTEAADKLAAEIAAFSPGGEHAPTAAAPIGEVDDADKLAAEISGFAASGDRTETKTEQDLASQIAAFVPRPGRSDQGDYK